MIISLQRHIVINHGKQSMYYVHYLSDFKMNISMSNRSLISLERSEK